MSGCASLTGDGAAGIAAALRAVDCRSGEVTASAFARLFGDQGALVPALTILLTLYVAIFAIGLLTGRARMGAGALTPRMMTLGLALTFATSWAAYQNVVWTLASGAPDQLAGLVAGTHGSATSAFADRLDRLFGVVADAAQASARPPQPVAGQPAVAAPTVAGFSASTVLWLAAIMLLLGTVGVIVTCKIALAALLALGPVFIVLALFGGTRGLFEGWCKGVALLALAPMLAVLLGMAAVVALDPVADGLAMAGADPDARAVGVLFLGACVYVALMAMAMKTATTLVAGWRLPGSREGGDARAARAAATAVAAAAPPAVAAPAAAAAPRGDDRVRRMVAGLPAGPNEAAAVPRDDRVRQSARVIALADRRPAAAAPSRALGVGSRFRAPPMAPGRGRAP